MSKEEKLIARLMSRPKDFTFAELTSILTRLGFKSFKKGKTAGSRVAFYNEENDHLIRLHKPHPGNIIKIGALKDIIANLTDFGYI